MRVGVLLTIAPLESEQDGVTVFVSLRCRTIAMHSWNVIDGLSDERSTIRFLADQLFSYQRRVTSSVTSAEGWLRSQATSRDVTT
jgi:hypothetical protein